MPEYKIVDAGKLDADLKVFADAIRAKLGTQASLRFPDEMATAISQISSSASSANVARGSVIPTQNYHCEDGGPTITHALGVVPNFYIFVRKNGGTVPINTVVGSVVIEYGDVYLTAMWGRTKSGGSQGNKVTLYGSGGYDDERDATKFAVYMHATADYTIPAGEEYIWVCGVLG